MMRRIVSCGVKSVFAILLTAAACLHAQRTPYLTGSAKVDLFLVLPPAPSNGDLRDGMDRAVFKATRLLEGSERWKMAKSDDASETPALMKDFWCALGAAPTPENAPRLNILITRAGVDSALSAADAKNKYNRKRPFVVDKGAVCKGGPDEDSPDYPSGHSTVGWTVGLILAEIAPDRAGSVLARARAYGDSRVFCGWHNVSAVEAGRIGGSAIFGALHSSKEFREDLAAAQAEVLALRRKSPYGAQSCVTEMSLDAMNPYAAPLVK